MVWWWLVSAVIPVIIYSVKYVYSYWERKGFPVLKAATPLGCLGPLVKQKQSMGEMVRDIHLRSKEPYLGLYMLFRPVLLIRDPALVKRVLISDFDHFTDRGVHYDEEDDPVGASLFGMPGQQWRELRNKLSPTFTSGKLKNMFQPIEEKCELLKDHLNQLTGSSNPVELKTLIVRLNLSVIASVFFGLELNSFEEPDHEFNKIGDIFFDASPLRNKLAIAAFFLSPALLKFFRAPTTPPIVSKYVLNLVRSVIEAREADPSLVRKDFIQTVMELREQAANNGHFKLTVENCAAQALLFYIAGYETSASTSSFCMWELIRSPVWLVKAQNEVDAVMKKRNGRILYEDLSELKVLDMCIKETMRKYPAAPMLNRECTKEYTIPGTDHVVVKGTPVLLSNFGLQMDPKNFPYPDVFDPSRFEAENAADDMPYYPLGGGPRYCVGARMGFMMIKMALCTLLHNYDLSAVDSRIDFLTGCFVLVDKNKIRVKISKRELITDVSL